MSKKLVVHRSRFAVCHPSGINALSLNKNGNLLAVGRSNGDIEIWNVEHGWFCVKKIPGSGESTIQVLLWAVTDGVERLFSAGLNARLIEWDLVTLRPLHASDSYGGAVWCGALSPNQNQLCVGCEDGSLRLFEITSDDGPVYQSMVGRHDSRVLSMSWARKDHIASGGADSTVRSWLRGASTSWRNSCRITVEAVNGEPTSVWTLTELSDGNLVTGDSLGNVQFWDLPHGTLRAGFKKHTADVLAVCSHGAGLVYASGVDNTVCQFKCTSDGKWKLTTIQRPHTHDVYALTLANIRGQGLRLISGGLDTQLCVYNATDFDKQRPVKIPPFLHSPVISASTSSPSLPKDVNAPRGGCCFLMHEGQTLNLYQLGSTHTSLSEASSLEDGAELPFATGAAHVLALHTNQAPPQPSGPSPVRGLNLLCSVLSPDCRWLACSDPFVVKLFRITWSKGGMVHVEPRAVELSPAVRLVFSADSTMLLGASLAHELQAVSLSLPADSTSTEDDALPPAARLFALPLRMPREGGLVKENKDSKEIKGKKTEAVAKRENVLASAAGEGGPTLSVVISLSVSTDGHWVCVGDEHNHLVLFNLRTRSVHASLPSLDSPHISTTFQSTGENICVLTASNQLYLFDTLTARLSDWSIKNGTKILIDRKQKLGQKFLHASFDPSDPSLLILQSHLSLCRVDLSQPVCFTSPVNGNKRRANQVAMLPGTSGSTSRKSQRAQIANSPGHLSQIAAESTSNELGAKAPGTFRNITRFQPLLFATFLGPQCLLVVESPWVKTLQTFQDTLFRRRYGN
jgi:U3 small nucleolar RNA-associated protein 4